MNDNCARQIEIELEKNYQQTIPSCNDCDATIVTTRIPRTRKGIGRRVQPSGKKQHCYLLGFQIPEESWEKTVALCLYELVASSHDLN